MNETQPSLEQVLPGNTSIFSDDNLNILKEIMYEQKVTANSHLYWEGDVADKLYYLKSGRVKITKSTDEGKELILYMHQSGDMLGQIDPFQNSRHVFSATALEDCTIGVLLQSDLEILVWQHGELAIDFMKWMGMTHRITQAKFRDMVMYGKPGALCSTLMRLSHTYGKKLENGDLLITKKLTHSELSDMIGATRESVNRMLNDLRKKEAVDYDNGYIVIKDEVYLQGICHCECCPLEICRV
ncbi:Crp/Fnr family transcriptional regulator [Gorillibacterium massiliense]|uniref:Crp/Fnr family transcriptional regulator n=1 Tax=Gorillibacterium massiliense TaxID=1280390 RepID=UPI0004AE9121|nr:Crp/Fnr family transcriptional regulator [Gorillibacterium massiliense]